MSNGARPFVGATAPGALYRSFATGEQIDAQYNPSAAVADAGACLRRYVEQSRLARERLPARLGLRYGPTLDETLDVFAASGTEAGEGGEATGAPVFVFLHGGYWRALSSQDFSFVALGLVPLGITTVVVNYSLCPKVTIDEITRQARAALAWVFANVGALGGDPKRVAVGGHSAGAHLAAMCLETRWDDDYGLARDPLAAALLVSGIYDIEPLRHSYLQPQIRLDDGVIGRNSPLFTVRPCSTPLLVAWGGAESDEFARQSTAFDAAWQNAGNRAELLSDPGRDHFTVIDGFEDPDSALCRWLAPRLLASRLAGQRE